MSLESKIFEKKKPIADKLIKYGFKKEKDTYIYQTTIMNGQFKVELTINKDVTGRVIDADTGDEYVLVHAENQVGNFVGEVRAEYTELLNDIAQECFQSMPFFSEQANQIAHMIEEKYSEVADFPFKRFPNYGVFRNKMNNKWYGLVMNITKDKLTNDSKDKEEKVEILDIKVEESHHAQLLKQSGFYLSYHMHKQSWITIILDGSVDNNEVMDLLEKSRRMSIGGSNQVSSSAWLVPGNPKYYDIDANFKVGKTTIWKQSTKININDMVYLYVTSPVKAVRFKCQVIKTDIPYQHSDSNVKIQKIMEVKVLKEYPADFCPFAKLKDFDIKAVRGPRRIPAKLAEYLK